MNACFIGLLNGQFFTEQWDRENAETLLTLHDLEKFSVFQLLLGLILLYGYIVFLSWVIHFFARLYGNQVVLPNSLHRLDRTFGDWLYDLTLRLCAFQPSQLLKTLLNRLNVRRGRAFFYLLISVNWVNRYLIRHIHPWNHRQALREEDSRDLLPAPQPATNALPMGPLAAAAAAPAGDSSHRAVSLTVNFHGPTKFVTERQRKVRRKKRSSKKKPSLVY